RSREPHARREVGEDDLVELFVTNDRRTGGPPRPTVRPYLPHSGSVRRGTIQFAHVSIENRAKISLLIRYALCRGGRPMRSDKLSSEAPQPQPQPQPQTRSELQAWIREHLRLAGTLEQSLLAAIEAVFRRHERLWQESKHEAIQALSAAFADKTARVKRELLAKDATVS